jgi:hypothetical protein
MESDRYIIKVIDHIKKEGHMHYIINVEKNGQNFSFTERYSGLRGLNEAMRKYTTKLTFPKFPPKKFFGSEEEKFIIKRQQEINTYFELICKDPDFVSIPPLIKFIEERRSKQNNVDKAPQIKKEPVKIEEKELKKSIQNNINNVKDFENIVKELNDKFYKVNDFYIQDNVNENNSEKFIKYFKNNKIDCDNIVKLDSGDENNFNLVNNNENNLNHFDDINKDKISKIEELYKSLDNIYKTDGIIVPI